MKKLNCFKAYDVRGKLGDELNEEIAWRIGRSYGQYLKVGQVAVGADARPSSAILKKALVNGLMESGADVLDLGLTGTEEIYFAVFSQKLAGGIEVTGSHNPISDNGLKFVREDSKPISGDSGLFDIKLLAQSGNFEEAKIGSYKKTSFKEQYIDHLLSYVNVKNFSKTRIVTNAGNGAAGPIIDLLESKFKELSVPVEFIKICHQPDGTFPNGIPNPLLPENRHLTSEAVIKYKADLGLAWDGDFDRCFFFDEKGEFIEGYYIVGLLAEIFLKLHHGASIIHDPRLIWNTIDIVLNNGGRPIESKTGHAFIKERMRSENAIYGGEMSAHHYFADFAYCDSGMIPWLLMLDLMGRKKQSLSKMISDRQEMFPCSGELNYTVNSIGSVLEKIESTFKSSALKIDYTDGLSMDMGQWRFNIRASNTEPLLRLNLESRKNPDLVSKNVALIEKIIKGTLN